MTISEARLSDSLPIQNVDIIDSYFPTIPFIPGDGIGREIWDATRMVVDFAVHSVFGEARKIEWKQVYAGEESYRLTGDWLPAETLKAFEKFRVGIKGPLTTPVGGGIRSLNVALRKNLDLYVCLRPIRYFEGIRSPIRNPEKVNITIFRENTEDLYAGIEFEAGSPDAIKLIGLLENEFPGSTDNLRFTSSVGIGIKPISKAGSERLVRAAMNYALMNNKQVLTLIHKGNIMKYTEGAFCTWGYDLMEREFGNLAFTSRQWAAIYETEGEESANLAQMDARLTGKIIVNDVITDAAFQKALIEPEGFDVIATTNINGDYLSDALAAQVGGIGISPGANINYETGTAIFEATHGTAPMQAGKNTANPASLILSAEMMLRFIGWADAADVIFRSLSECIRTGEVTEDLTHDPRKINPLGTREFGLAICRRIKEQAQGLR